MHNLIYYALSAVVVLITLTVHEYAHALAAYKMGDPTARNLGRLTLNPLKHLDPIGALCLLIFHFGWAKPVPINARNFKNPKRGFAISALAGPAINLIISFFSALIYLVLLRLFSLLLIYVYNIIIRIYNSLHTGRCAIYTIIFQGCITCCHF